MLDYVAMEKGDDGLFRVGYMTPGCNVMTVVCECRTKAQAIFAANECNEEKILRQAAIDAEREACARRRIHIDEERH